MPMNSSPQPPPLPAQTLPPAPTERGPIARFFIGVWDAMNFTRRLILNLLFFFLLFVFLLIVFAAIIGGGVALGLCSWLFA